MPGPAKPPADGFTSNCSPRNVGAADGPGDEFAAVTPALSERNLPVSRRDAKKDAVSVWDEQNLDPASRGPWL
ncbi:hypothetical protein [Actinocrispum sp. NPDC049592]|uniref:hypothetical protein n=1 Tax=Actinocrispum sp. NPDC049592 TaxID=3154835 RepID=UPI00341C8DA5